MDTFVLLLALGIGLYLLHKFQQLRDEVRALRDNATRRDQEVAELRQAVKAISNPAPPTEAPSQPTVAPPVPAVRPAAPVAATSEWARPAAPALEPPVSVAAPSQSAVPETPLLQAAAAPALPPDIPVTPQPAVLPPSPPASPRPAPPAPAPVAPAEPTWWERASTLALENWTGILGAAILVIGVGFLGIYAALKMAPIYRFFMISGFAAALLVLRYFLRTRPFAATLSVWLQSSAAAIFLFACVGAVSIPGLQWASTPFDYGLLFLGVGTNLYLAWTSSRESVATLHGVLSLIALAVLPPTLLTLGAGASVTVFGIAITYRNRWQYQLLLSIVSFAAFHWYWHQPGVLSSGGRLTATGLVVLVGAAAAVVQYRKLYSQGKFQPLLFAAHVLNWTCLGINLYLHSTGSPWKTIPLGLGAGLTFWAARYARRLGIQWLFQTDTVISLILALAAAFSLLAWQASSSFVLLFMLLETLLIAFIMARENEWLVYRIATAGALAAGGFLLLLNLLSIKAYMPTTLYQHLLLVLLAGWAATGYTWFAGRLPAFSPANNADLTNRGLVDTVGSLGGALQACVAVLLAWGFFQLSQPRLAVLFAVAGGAALAAFGLATVFRNSSPLRRTMQLVLGQLFLMVAIIGLHKTGLSWAWVVGLLYLEALIFGVLMAREAGLVFQLNSVWLLGLAGALPFVVMVASYPVWPANQQALLLLGAALATVLYQLALAYTPLIPAKASPPTFPYAQPLAGLMAGWLLLFAGVPVYEQQWAAWVAAAVLSALLYLRQRQQVPGLWLGLLLASVGFFVLHWGHVVFENRGLSASGSTLVYMLPLLALPVAGWFFSLAADALAARQHRRWPWLYLLGLHTTLMVWAIVARHADALVLLAWLGLASLAFAGAQWLRQRWPTSQELATQGTPDRFLLHLAYALLGAALLWHLTVMQDSTERLLGLPARYVTVGALLGVLGWLMTRRAPTQEPIYRSWRYGHPLLLETALLLVGYTLGQEVPLEWLPLAWVALALLLTTASSRLPASLARLSVYGRLLYWLATAHTILVLLHHPASIELFQPGWWGLAGAVALLFVYVGLEISHPGPPRVVQWPLGLQWLAGLGRLSQHLLISGLLYPAFLALTLLLIVSFDRSILTVVLMLEVFAVFTASIVLRRPDLRYVALAGMVGCVIRLVGFDLRQTATITRAVVFIFMGLLLLGMNALYARFKDRFATIPESNDIPPRPEF